MQTMKDISDDIERRVRPFARPDSRFHLDFSRFIPGFEGDDKAAERLSALPACRRCRRVFVTPDNALAPARRRLLESGRDLVLPTYGLHDGFILISAEAIPPEHALSASWLDGAQHFGKPVSLAALCEGGAFDLVVAGAAAVDRAGRRFGMGSHYLDIEWGIFAEAGLVNESTSIVAIVHDTQISEQPVPTSESHVHADVVITPTQTLAIGVRSRPRSLDWALVDPELSNAPPLRELKKGFS